MLSSPWVNRTYSTKSVEVAWRVSPRAVVGDAQAARTGDEVDVVAADLGVGAPAAVVESERRRRGADGFVDNLAREENALARGIGLEPCLQEALAERRTADLHSDLGQHSTSLVEDLRGQVVVEYSKSRAHRRPSSRIPPVDSGAAGVHAYVERPFHIAE